MPRVILFVFAAFVFVACRGDDDRDPSPRAVTCGAVELPTPEGTCAAVGVPRDGCGAGFTHDGNAGCTPILPAEECGEGTMPVIGETACRSVGVDACAMGFRRDRPGSCAAILPAEECGDGRIAVPGDEACREIAACGSGTWGDIPVEASTIYVDASYAGGASDGSAARPHRTIRSAIDAATGAPIIAVAAGTYVEAITIDRPLRLFGRCPSMVEVRAPAGTTTPSITVTAAASVHRLSVSGPSEGVLASAKGVSLEEVRVHATGGSGVRITAGATTLRRSLIERATGNGVEVLANSTVAVESSVVRDTQATADGAFGTGIAIRPRCTANVVGSVVSRNRAAGILVRGGTATITATLVRDTQPQTLDKRVGRGIQATADPTTKLPGNVTIRGAVVERNHDGGIALYGSKAVIASTVVRDTQPQAADKGGGFGIVANVDSVTGLLSQVDVRDTLVERSHTTGIRVFGSRATLESTIVRDTQPQASDRAFGRGVSVDLSSATVRSDARLRYVLVERNHGNGLFVAGSTATLEHAVVRDTRPQASDEKFGRGIFAQFSQGVPAELSITATIVERNRRVGIGLQGSTAMIDGSIVRDTLPDASTGDLGRGIVAVDDAPSKQPSNLEVRRCLVERNHQNGIGVAGSSALIEATVVRETLPDAATKRFGRGVTAQFDALSEVPASIVVRTSLFEKNHNEGLFVSAATATVEDTIIRDTLAQVSDGAFGDAILANAGMLEDGTLLPSPLEVRRSILERSARAGLVVFAASASIEASRISCNRIDIDIEPLTFVEAPVAPTLKDLGGNQCGCAAATPCKAQSAGLQPIEAIDREL